MARQQLIRFDWAVKKLLRSKANFGILEGFLSELLKFNLTILEVLDSESSQNNKDNKFNRVDILVKLDSNEIVLVEIQVDSEPDYFCRMLFGTAKVITEHLRTGDEYINVKKVYSVNILYFDLGHGDDYIYHGTTNFIGTHTNNKLELSDKQQQLYKKDKIQHIYPEYYLIKVNQFNDIAKDALDEWIYFLKHETIKDSFKAKGLAEAREKLDSMKLSEQEMKEYDRYVEDVRYRNSMVSSNFNMGKIEGEKIGIQKGIQEGREKGIQEGQAKLIKNLLASGMSVEQVAMATKMIPSEVEKLTQIYRDY